MQAQISELYRYPVKGMSAEALDEVDLTVGETIPFDRAYAIENGGGRFDPLAPRHLPKINFIMLMRDEKLAALETRFNAATQTLTIFRGGKQVASGQLTTTLGRSMIEQFVAGFLGGERRGSPKIVLAEGHSFSDVPIKCLHIVNLATIAELERAAGEKIHPLRFRANVYLSGLEPWAEFNLVDKHIVAGGARLRVFDKTVRCAATNVNPETAQRDMAIPQLLQRNFGHDEFGIYASVIEPGRVAVGDTVESATQ